MQTVAVLHGVDGRIIKKLFSYGVAAIVLTLLVLVGCHAIEGEHVDGQTTDKVELAAQDIGRLLVLNARKLIGVHRVLQSANQLVSLGQPLVGMLHKLVVVFAGQGHIGIVIPWHKSLVSHGSQHGAGNEIIAQVVLTAHLVNGDQHVENVFL